MNLLTKKIQLLSAVAVVSLMAASSAQAAVTLLDDNFSSSAIVVEALQLNDLGSGDWRAISGTKWDIDNTSGGSLSNAGGGTAAQNEGAIGKLIDLTGITATDLNQLTLNVDFNTVTASEELFVHIRGYAGGSPISTTNFLNQAATAGNIWDLTGAAFTTKYNLNTGETFDAFANTGFEDSIELTDGVSTGAQSFSQTFDMSGYGVGVNNIADFDYLVVAFTRDAAGTSPVASIDSITLTAIPEPGTYALLAGLTGLVSVMVRRRRS